MDTPEARPPTSFTKLLEHRRSTKMFREASLAVELVQDLLRTTIGRTPQHRPYGSAYARYAVTASLIAGHVEGLDPAVYRYDPVADALTETNHGDHRPLLARATFDADWLTRCPAALILTADLDAANAAFTALEPDRGTQFCWFEAGLITQNVHLWAADNALGTVFIGGLRMDVADAPETRGLLPDSHTMLGILPIGYPAT